MSYKKLVTAIKVVNTRYAKGLNDDDAVGKMFDISSKLKGFSIKPGFDTYEICTDLERLEVLVNDYGKDSNEVAKFNLTLVKKGSVEYKDELNAKL